MPGPIRRRCLLAGHESWTSSAASSTCRRPIPSTSSLAGIAWATTSLRNSLLALDAKPASGSGTSRRCKHDVWDRDVPSPPSLITVKRDGKNVDAVAIATKSGHVWVFDRTNGTPLFPIEYKKYPAEHDSRRDWSETQPLPTRPAPFARQLLTADMLTTADAGGARGGAGAVQEDDQRRAIRPAQRRRRYHLFPWLRWRRANGVARRSIQTPVCCTSIRTKWRGPTGWPRLRNQAQVVSGKDIYGTQCAACHRDDRTGAPPAIPSLVDIGKRLQRRRSAVDHTQRQGRMPGFPALAADQIAAIISYVRDGVESTVPVPADAKPVPWDSQYRFTGFNKFLDIDGYPGGRSSMGHAECHQHEHR